MNSLVKLGALLFTLGVVALVSTVVILNDTGHSGFDLAGGSLLVIGGSIVLGMGCMIVGWMGKG